MERKPVFPAFLRGRALSVVWLACGVFAIVYGFISGGAGYEVIGAFALIGAASAYPLAHFVLNRHACDDAVEAGEPAHDD